MIDAIDDDADFGAHIVGVISDRPHVRALDRAREAGIASLVVDWDDYESREAFTAAIVEAAETLGAELLVLAGFMRVLSAIAIERFPNRIVNIHPALLPSFPGASAVEDALAYGVEVTGVTVHFVDEKVDNGPIIAQEAVPVLPGDDVTTLHDRIQSVEHRLYPSVVKKLAAGALTVVGRRVVWQDGGET